MQTLCVPSRQARRRRGTHPPCAAAPPAPWLLPPPRRTQQAPSVQQRLAGGSRHSRRRAGGSARHCYSNWGAGGAPTCAQRSSPLTACPQEASRGEQVPQLARRGHARQARRSLDQVADCSHRLGACGRRTCQARARFCGWAASTSHHLLRWHGQPRAHGTGGGMQAPAGAHLGPPAPACAQKSTPAPRSRR